MEREEPITSSGTNNKNEAFNLTKWMMTTAMEWDGET